MLQTQTAKNTTQLKIDRWKAIRSPSGNIYCAAACGAGCTWVKYQRAVADAAVLAAECGDEYTPRVHENLGWHFSALSACGRFYVIKHAADRYSAFLGEAFSYTGRWTGSGKTAKAALKNAVNHCKADLRQFADFAREL